MECETGRTRQLDAAQLPDGYRELAERIGSGHLAARLSLQASHWARLSHQGQGLFRIERYISIDRLADIGLRCLGLRKRAYQNFLDIRIVELDWYFERLPAAFDGFRLMQLSDLHLDLDPALGKILVGMIRHVPHDAAVVTGDYRNSTDEDYGPSLEASCRIVPELSAERFGILGNHDFLEIVWGLEEAGLPILLNENRTIERGGESISIVGVDDPHFYGAHDFARARRGIPDGRFSILLCHSPEVADPASEHPFDLMLCGHTHGGQLCLPGGRALVVPVNDLPRDRIKGRWKAGSLPGYTSPGTGSCGVSARLNCPPEITLHILHHHHA